jgi:hypothetical protein
LGTDTNGNALSGIDWCRRCRVTVRKTYEVGIATGTNKRYPLDDGTGNPSCEGCEWREPKTDELTEEFIAFYESVKHARGDMGGLDYSYALSIARMEYKQSEDDVILMLLKTIPKIESVRNEWNSQKK